MKPKKVERRNIKAQSRVWVRASDRIAEDRCQKFTFDTYEREVERYGGIEAAEISEALFAADSLFVIELLSTAPSLDLTVLAAATVDNLLGGLGLDSKRRLAWLKTLATSSKEIADEYRTKRQTLIAALREPKDLSEPLSEIFLQRKASLASIADRLLEFEAARSLIQPLSRLYESYVHMHCNRLGVDWNAEQRVMSLLVRAREAIAHMATGVSEDSMDSVGAAKT